MKGQADPRELYPQVETLLECIAWDFVRRYPRLRIEDVRTEAYHCFMTAARRFNPDCGAQFKTWCRFIVTHRLKSYVRSLAQDRLVPVENEELCAHVGTTTQQRPASLDIVSEMGEDARELVSLLVESPAEILETGARTTRDLIRSVREYLMDRKGWKRDHFRRTFVEVQDTLREAWSA